MAIIVLMIGRKCILKEISQFFIRKNKLVIGIVRGDIQKLFQKCDFALSKGYESYSPLLVKTGKEEVVEETMAGEEQLEIVVY